MSSASDASGSTGETDATLTGRGNVRGERTPRTRCARTMDASESTPPKGESAVGESLERRVREETAEMLVDLVADSLVFVRGDPDSEELLVGVRKAQVQLEMAENILAEEVKREGRDGGATTE